MNLHFEDARKHKKEIRRLFVSAFPRDERPPIALLYLRHRQKRASFRAVMDGEKMVGLVLMRLCDRWDLTIADLQESCKLTDAQMAQLFPELYP